MLLTVSSGSSCLRSLIIAGNSDGIRNKMTERIISSPITKHPCARSGTVNARCVWHFIENVHPFRTVTAKLLFLPARFGTVRSFVRPPVRGTQRRSISMPIICCHSQNGYYESKPGRHFRAGGRGKVQNGVPFPFTIPRPFHLRQRNER